jgi:hypothetical protein
VRSKSNPLVLASAVENPLMHQEELFYIAGFLDGEGCFHTPVRGRRMDCVLSCANTHKPTLDWIQKVLGGKVYRHGDNRVQAKKPQYVWIVRGQLAIEICRTIAPFLKQKAKQALLMLSLHQTIKFPKNGTKLKPEAEEERARLTELIRQEKHIAW